MQGTPNASAWSATGTTVSEVDVTIMTSTPSLVIRSPATVAARLESDWESLTRISTGCDTPSAVVMPSLTVSVQRFTQYVSASPNAAKAPVCGETKPILIVRPPPLPLPLSPELELPHAASAPPRPPPTPSAAAPRPAVFRKSRRLTRRSPMEPLLDGCS